MRRVGGEGGRAGGRATEQFDAAQLRAGECDEQVLSAAVARRERAAGALCGPGAQKRRERRREQPPVGGHRGAGGQARDGVNLVLLVPLVGWVCSSSAQKEANNSTAVLSVVSFLDAPSSTPPKSWLVVARDASARLRLVGHLGWVHRHEARPVGQPRELMMPHREALTPRRDTQLCHEKREGRRGGSSIVP